MTIKLHRHALSGHCHRVQLMLRLLDVDHELIDVDLAAGAHKAEAFLALNPLGQVPVLEDEDKVLSDSNAIVVYLVRRYAPSSPWLPTDPVLHAQVQRWLSIAANEIAHGPAAARLVTVFGAQLDHEATKAKAARILGVVESELRTGPWIVQGEEPTVADVALYTYIAHAPEGGIQLNVYPAIQAWLARVEGLPRFVPMQATPPKASS